MTDAQADAILAALRELTAEVKALRADLAPKKTTSFTPGTSWPSSSMYQCATCGSWITFGMDHSCPGVRWTSTTVGTNQA
jgi:hypothetical protein